MNDKIHSPLQMREVFHLEFLRWFGRKLEAEYYLLKGGVNLRFFFRSIRYSEDMDIDIQGVRVERVKKTIRAFSGITLSTGVQLPKSNPVGGTYPREKDTSLCP